MIGPREFSGTLLRTAAAALEDAPPSGEDAALSAVTGLCADELPRLKNALALAGKRLERVVFVHLNEPGSITGEGEIADGVEYVFELEARRRKKPLPPLVRVVKKGERLAAPPPSAPRPVLPSSPPKHDIPIGRGIFSSSGKRESARPGVAPLPMDPKPTSSAAATGTRAVVRPPVRGRPGKAPGRRPGKPARPASPSGKRFGGPKRSFKPGQKRPFPKRK
jgi:hypothetical protein